jgi:hypothetical protein
MPDETRELHETTRGGERILIRRSSPRTGRYTPIFWPM